LAIGSSRASSVSFDYEGPFRYRGTIENVVYDIGDDDPEPNSPSCSHSRSQSAAETFQHFANTT
jgi:hypothetical protein